MWELKSRLVSADLKIKHMELYKDNLLKNLKIESRKIEKICTDWEVENIGNKYHNCDL